MLGKRALEKKNEEIRRVSNYVETLNRIIESKNCSIRDQQKIADYLERRTLDLRRQVNNCEERSSRYAERLVRSEREIVELRNENKALWELVEELNNKLTKIHEAISKTEEETPEQSWARGDKRVWP